MAHAPIIKALSRLHVRGCYFEDGPKGRRLITSSEQNGIILDALDGFVTPLRFFDHAGGY